LLVEFNYALIFDFTVKTNQLLQIIIFMLFIANSMFAQKDKLIEFDGKFLVENSNVTDEYSIVVVHQSGKREDIKVNSKGLFFLFLSLNTENKIYFSKNGYMGNIITVNTTVDALRARKGFPVHEVHIELRSEIEGRKSDITYLINYDDYNENFDFTENYRTTTNNHIKKINAENALAKQNRLKTLKDSLALLNNSLENDKLKKDEAEKLRLEILALNEAERLRLAEAEKVIQVVLAKARAEEAENARLAILAKANADAAEKQD